ncbi:hypothetical protein [Flindersiella endophytica]
MEVIPQMWVPTEVPKLIHQQHLRDAQLRLQYRQFRQQSRRLRRSGSAGHKRTPKASPRRALGVGLVRLGLWMVAGTARPTC